MVVSCLCVTTREWSSLVCAIACTGQGFTGVQCFISLAVTSGSSVVGAKQAQGCVSRSLRCSCSVDGQKVLGAFIQCRTAASLAILVL